MASKTKPKTISHAERQHRMRKTQEKGIRFDMRPKSHTSYTPQRLLRKSHASRSEAEKQYDRDKKEWFRLEYAIRDEKDPKKRKPLRERQKRLPI